MLTEIANKFHPLKIFLGIGVAKIVDERNWWGYNEIKEMITPIIRKLNIDYEIKPIPDINDSPKYGEHVATIFPEINESNTTLYTDNTYTSDCFVNFGHNYEVVKPTIQPGRATMVREMILKNENWQQFVPSNVAEFIERLELDHSRPHKH